MAIQGRGRSAKRGAQNGGGWGQPLGVDPVQGQDVVQDVRPLWQMELRRGDDEVELAQRRPRPTDQDIAGPTARLPPNPARDVLVGAKGEDDEIRPGRRELARAAPVDAGEGCRQDQVGQKLELSIRDSLDLKRPAERLGQPDHLRVVPFAVAGEHPDPWWPGAGGTGGAVRRGVSQARRARGRGRPPARLAHLRGY